MILYLSSQKEIPNWNSKLESISITRPSTHTRIRTLEAILVEYPMKHVIKILTILVAISALWIGLLHASVIPHGHTWLLPIYFIVTLGCYGLLMVGIGLMQFPTCPQEAVLLQQDIVEAKEFLKHRGVDVGFD